MLTKYNKQYVPLEIGMRVPAISGLTVPVCS